MLSMYTVLFNLTLCEDLVQDIIEGGGGHISFTYTYSKFLQTIQPNYTKFKLCAQIFTPEHMPNFHV